MNRLQLGWGDGQIARDVAQVADSRLLRGLFVGLPEFVDVVDPSNAARWIER
jgi:hypothetical protein